MNDAEERRWLTVQAHARSRAAIAVATDLSQSLTVLKNCNYPKGAALQDKAVDVLKQLEEIAAELKSELYEPGS